LIRATARSGSLATAIRIITRSKRSSAVCRTFAPALAAVSDEEIADMLELFGVPARYNHLTKTVEVTVTLAPELGRIAETRRPPEGGRRKLVIAGAGFEPATSGL
jgi:hypothetical protein